MSVIVTVLTFDNVEDNQYPDIDQKEEVLNNFLARIDFVAISEVVVRTYSDGRQNEQVHVTIVHKDNSSYADDWQSTEG
ncbi:MAG: hypothetical protein R3B38_02470 [Patescibacteria group bacterium]